MPSKLSFHQVSFRYEQVPIVENLSFDVADGEFISVIGPSGIGKSTLFQLANGLLQPKSGSISLDGKIEANRLGKVAYMPQQDLLLPWRTVAANAALPLEIQGVSAKEARDRVMAQLSLFGLQDVADAYPHQLSGGMRQRVSLLRSTLSGSELLLLDEPFSALDGITRMVMQEWLLQLLAELERTVVMITHDLEEAILLSDRVLVIQDRPIQTVVEVPVPLNRETRSTSRHDTRVLALRDQIWKELQKSTHTRHQRESNYQGGIA